MCVCVCARVCVRVRSAIIQAIGDNVSGHVLVFLAHMSSFQPPSTTVWDHCVCERRMSQVANWKQSFKLTI